MLWVFADIVILRCLDLFRLQSFCLGGYVVLDCLTLVFLGFGFDLDFCVLLLVCI